jgi:hypothetical protein
MRNVMFAKIGKRFTYANVTVTLALVFAMSGGAYAAGKYLITSTKQINPKVLKTLQGKNGKNGPAGPAGPAGATGPTGATGAPAKEGPPGKEGAPGKEGSTGKEGKEGKEGKAGSPWIIGALPTGASETGTWTISEYHKEGEFILVPISFSVPLASALDATHVHYIESGITTLPTGCAGNAEKPEAESGNLCVFTKLAVNLGTMVINGVEGATGAGKTGAYLAGKAIFTSSPKEGEVIAIGTWVVTG